LSDGRYGFDGSGRKAGVEPRFVAIVLVHLVGALVFAAMAVRSAVLGDPVIAVMQGVLAVLVVVLGVRIVRAV
jgi:hypothetical protein